MNNSLKYKSCDFAIMAFPIVLDIENEYTQRPFLQLRIEVQRILRKMHQ